MCYPTPVDSRELTDFTHVTQRVPINNQKVSIPTGRNTPDIILLSQVARGNRGDRFERIHRTNRFSQQLNLTQKGKSRRRIGQPTTVRPAHDQTTGFM